MSLDEIIDTVKTKFWDGKDFCPPYKRNSILASIDGLKEQWEKNKTDKVFFIFPKNQSFEISYIIKDTNEQNH